MYSLIKFNENDSYIVTPMFPKNPLGILNATNIPSSLKLMSDYISHVHPDMHVHVLITIRSGTNLEQLDNANELNQQMMSEHRLIWEKATRTLF